MKKIIIHIIILSSLSLSVLAKDKVVVQGLDDLTQELMTHNPELKSLLEKIKVAKANISLSTAWEDPMFVMGTEDVPVGGVTNDRNTMLMFELNQKVAFPGKLKVKKEMATIQKNQQNEEYLEKLNQLISKFYLTYYDYAYLSEAQGLYQITAGQLNAMKGILESRYAAGEIEQPDILKTKVEVSKVQESLVELQGMQQIARAKMLAILNREPGSNLKVQGVKNLSQLSKNLSYYLNEVKNKKPWLRRAELMVQEEQAAKKMAKRELLPDFDFMVGYEFMLDTPMGMETEDYMTAKVGVNIPIFTAIKQKKRIAAAESKIISAQYEQQAMQRELAAEIEMMWIEIHAASKRIHILQNRIIPEMQASLESAQRSYETGEMEYINVIMDRLDLFKMKLEVIKLKYEREKRIVELKMNVGEFGDAIVVLENINEKN